MSIKSVLSTLLNFLLGIIGFVVSLVTKPIIYLSEVLMNTKFGFWKYAIATYVALFVLAGVLWFFPITIGDVSWNWGLEIILLLAIYSMPPWSWKAIGPSEKACRYFFGFALDSIGPGLAFAPWGLVQIEIFPNEIQQMEFPAEPGNIYRGNEKDPDGKVVPSGMASPIRILSGQPTVGTQPANAYDHQMVVEACGVLTFQISDALLFRRSIKSLDNAKGPILDAMIAVLGEELSKDTPAKAMLRFTEINKRLHDEIDMVVRAWGIDVKSVLLKPFTFSHDLNKAVLEVPKALREKEASIIKAEGKKQVLTLEGEGVGAAKKAELDGETDGRKRMAKELNVDGSAILAAETARAITSNPGQKTIIAGGSGFKDLALVGESIATSFANQKGA